MSENTNETPAEKTSILTTAMLSVKNKLTVTTVPNEDANQPKKTLKTTVAFGLGVIAGTAGLVAAIKIAAAKVQDEANSDEDSPEFDA